MTTQNSFTGAVLKFPNKGIHFLLAEIIKFRKQLTVRPEFKGQSGWTDALNVYMVENLEKIARTLSRITYLPSNVTKDELEAQAADNTRTLMDDYDNYSTHADNVLLPAQMDMEIVWRLDGSDPDIPQLTPENMPNDFARAFVRELDQVFVTLTALDSRHSPHSIIKDESKMVRAMLNNLITICQEKGGEVNKPDVPTGVLPSMVKDTFSGTYDNA